jgi:GT2 family glycosyltransferase
VPSFSPPRYRRLRGGIASVFSDSEAGGNMAVRRRVFDAVGEFDLYLGAGAIFPSCDDNDLNDRALHAGFAVVHDPDNAVLHWGARPYADGSARRLVLGDAFAFGALLAKELRCGDPVALLRLSRLLVNFGWSMAPSLLRGRRPTGAARLLCAIDGFWRGLHQPLDHGARVFLGRQG